jgi:ribonuclease E
MVINASSGDECRIAVLLEKRLEELFIERQSAASHVGNIYKGVITNVEPSIQACFVDFGLPKHGFLHISDVQPQYFGSRGAEPEGVGKKTPRRERPPIQKCFRRGQEVMVQITKEGVGTKGPTLTTYLSIPGSYLVMMPGMSRLGVSRKIEDEEQRRAMREMLGQLTLPKDMGFILRTAGVDQTKRELQRDLNYLRRLWNTVVKRVRTTDAPAELYQESDLVIRTIRDVFTTDFERIIVDTPETADKVRDFLRIAMPRTPEGVVENYNAREPIFHHYGIEDQIEAIHARNVRLPSGGSIVIDTTEALVAIDVNSGKFRSVADEEEMAYQTNQEAAQEIARQLRLRDLGGLIVCDFIDMRLDRHKRAVEKLLRDELKKHKERARILRFSKFGLIEMTRQRQGPSIKHGVYTDCPHCKGSGLVKSPESMTLHVLRNIQTIVHRNDVARLFVTVSPDVAYDLQNRKRAALAQLEAESGKSIIIRAEFDYTWDQLEYKTEDDRGRITRHNIDGTG